MNVKLQKLLLTSVAVVALGGGVAMAQQPPAGQGQPRPMPAQPGQPGQARPGMPPGMPGMPPGAMPPGGRRPPPLPPGFNPNNNPHKGLPGGGLPHGGRRTRPGAFPQPQEEEHTGHQECPGHGADDPPPHPNWWRGLLMVNNERVEQGGFLNELLFRYENPKDHCDPKNLPPPFLASVINFGILAFILFKFGKKPLAEALKKRKATIMAEIDQATRLKEDAEARLEDYEERLENIEAKLADVRAEYAAQAEQEKKRILAEAEERRIRMRKDAEVRVEQELKAARAALLEEAVLSACTAAEALVQKQIMSKDHDKMQNDYLTSLGSALAGGR